MTTIKNLRFWKDTGYTDGSTEIPPLNQVMKPYDFLYMEDVIPQKERLFTEMQLHSDYLEMLDMSYLAFNLDMNNGADLTVYGWVDDVRVQSDTEDFPLTIVSWHIDPWRTFGIKAKYGSGTVIRRPHTDDDFYQGYSYIYKNAERRVKLIDSPDYYWWVLLVRQVKDSEEKISRIEFVTYPVFTGGVNELTLTKGTDSHTAPNFYTTITAGFDERLEFNPDTITGAWILPFPPISGIVQTDTSTFRCDNVYWKLDTHGYLTMDGTYNPDYFGEFSGTVEDMKSTETAELLITGFMGDTIGSIPYGRTINSYKYRVRASATEAVLEFRFDGLESNSEGLCFDMSLPALDVNSNSWSSYVMSGQRAYDIMQRNLKSQQSMIEGVSSGLAQGAMMGGLVRGASLSRTTARYANGTATAVRQFDKAGAKSIAGYMGVGAASSLIGGALELGVFNDQYQAAEDKLHASQPDSILYTGLGGDIAKYGGMPAITVMTPDSEAMKAIESVREVQGVSYGFPLSDCTDIINRGGPLQINNLIVRGEIPVGVKKWIKEKFAAGVRIVER